MRLVVPILILAAILRIGWGFSRPADDAALAALPDQLEYLKLGRSLLAGDGLVMTDPRFGTAVYAFRAPGYPAFVALFGGNTTFVRLAQALLDTSTVFASFLLARRYVPQYAWVAAALTAVCPFLIYFSALILTETLFTALLVWGVVALTTPQAAPKTRYFLLGVVVLCLSVLVRPGALALPVLLAGLAAMTAPRLPKLPVLATALAVAALTLLPWAYRNHTVLNEWVFTTTNVGITAYDGFNPAADGSSNQSAFLPHLPHLSALTETQRNHHLKQLEADYRAENPARLYLLTLQKLLRTWSPVPLSQENRSWEQLVASAVYCSMAWSLAVVGLLKFRGPGHRGMKSLTLLTATYLTLSAVLTVGSLRYRIPVEPLLAVLASMGAAALAQRFKLFTSPAQT